VSQNQIPALADLVSGARIVALPLRTKFRGLEEREVLLFEGPNGWAEWSPFVEYPDEEAAVWLAAAIDFAYGNLPNLYRERIPVNATLPAVAPEHVERVLTNFGEFATVKIKVAEAGQNIGKIRLDANGGFEAPEAIDLINQLKSLGINIEYFEQPVASIAEMAELKLQVNRLGIKIAADESVRKVSDPLAVAQANAADILILKAAPLGGILRALEIAAEAELPVVVSSALDSSVGLSMGAYLAAAIPNLDFDCGLATSALLAGDVTREPLRAENGFIDVRRVEVDKSKLEIFSAQDHRQDWWLERLERVYKLL
jgi:o-succinylbenzoate synthase